MASSEIEAILAKCPSPENGCFASSPNSLSTMLYMDDAVTRSDFQRAAEAAIEAGTAGIPLDEAEYEPATLDVHKVIDYPDPDETMPRGIAFAGVGSAPRQHIMAEGELDGMVEVRREIARCAYACGTMAVGCPVRTTPEA